MLSSMTLEGRSKGAKHFKPTPHLLIPISAHSKTTCRDQVPLCSSALLCDYNFPFEGAMLTSEPQ